MGNTWDGVIEVSATTMVAASRTVPLVVLNHQHGPLLGLATGVGVQVHQVDASSLDALGGHHRLSSARRRSISRISS